MSMIDEIIRWVLRVLVLIPAGCMLGLCAGVIWFSSQGAWWEPVATFPWWGFGILIAILLVRVVWEETERGRLT